MYWARVLFYVSTATRDYEELRRRYNEANNEREKLSQKLHQSNSQLESLRKGNRFLQIESLIDACRLVIDLVDADVWIIVDSLFYSVGGYLWAISQAEKEVRTWKFVQVGGACACWSSKSFCEENGLELMHESELFEFNETVIYKLTVCRFDVMNELAG